MEFSVSLRDGPARMGALEIHQEKVTTPNILFVHTCRFKAPRFADVFITRNGTTSTKPALTILGSSFSPVKTEQSDALSLNNYLVYPKDVSSELHVCAIQSNKKRKTKWFIIPATEEIIEPALETNDAVFYIVANAKQLISQQTQFVRFITTLREKMGYQRVLYLPSLGDPSSLALFTYLGIDLFDSLAAIVAARNKVLLFPTGGYHKDHLLESSCPCPICTDGQGTPSTMQSEEILTHNYYMLYAEMRQVRNAISQGRLRELVETRVRAQPELTAILRILDLDHYKFLEERTPITRRQKLIATTKEALIRPEVRRFQDRVRDRYKKPSSSNILLLLPCSAKKPYSFSKSHRFFRDILFSRSNPHVVHEVMVTSPLGIVPRELEVMYPASSYDIPVTGYWDEDEKKMIRTVLQRYVQTNSYDTIVMHLPLAIQEFISDLIPDALVTCEDKPTSSESLDALSTSLQKTVTSYDNVKASARAQEEVASLAMVQFGKKPAQALLKNSEIKGRYPYRKLLSKKKQLGMITHERGLISLTLDGAERLQDTGKYWVEMHSGFQLKGSLFSPGVKDADPGIRIGDEVIVLQKKTVCAVGVAMMNGSEMKEVDHGEAVKTRHCR